MHDYLRGDVLGGNLVDAAGAVGGVCEDVQFLLLRGSIRLILLQRLLDNLVAPRRACLQQLVGELQRDPGVAPGEEGGDCAGGFEEGFYLGVGVGGVGGWWGGGGGAEEGGGVGGGEDGGGGGGGGAGGGGG